MALNLQIIIASTRPGRKGPIFANWLAEIAREHAQFNVEVVDLANFALPLLDEPVHPMKREYQHAHTRAWSEKIDGADAFVFVSPEYNFSAPPALVNALDYLHHEWKYKPAGILGYGGISGGLRAIQTEKLMLTSLSIMPIAQSVAVQNFPTYLDDEGNFTPIEPHISSARTMLDELHRWAVALKPMRQPGGSAAEWARRPNAA